MGLLVTIVIVVVAGSVLAAVTFVRHELRPAPRRGRRVSRRTTRRVTAGDGCSCGGTIGVSGKISKKFGELLGCTACQRLWTLDGRRLRRRRPAYVQVSGGTD